MGALFGLQAEFHEHVRDVLLDGAGRDHESFGDPGIRQTLRHQREHFTFARRQPVDLGPIARTPEDLADHLGVDGAAAGGDATQRGEEVVDVDHAVLQEVSDT